MDSGDQRQSLLEFALGSQTVQLKQQIDQLTQAIETQTRKRTLAEKALTGVASPYTVAQFIALESVSDAQQQIDALRRELAASTAAINGNANKFRNQQGGRRG